MKNIKLLLPILFVLIRIITLAQPTITTFAPINGPVGTTVIINGTNFNVTPANNIVFFGATMATVTSASSSSLTVIVPSGATYQNISVTDLTTSLTAYSAHPFVTTFDCGIIDSNSFAPKTDNNIGLGLFGVAIADFDGDGKSDIVVADGPSDNILVFRNTSTIGTISFAPEVSFQTGDSPRGVSISDLNGDGKPDLAVTSNSTTISVFKNSCTTGIISFETKVDFTVVGGPWNISIGDLDNDGKPDLAVANDGSANVSILRNNSTGGMISFAIKEDFASGLNPGVTLGDLDGDGKLDLAVVNWGSNSLSVLKNTSTPGTISFAPKVDYSTGINPNDISIVDFDGDGKLDIAVVNQNSDTISIFRNTSIIGMISLAPKVDYTTGNMPIAIAISDLDGDSKPDIAVTDASFVSVFKNASSIGTIFFAPKMDYNIENDISNIAIGDLDGDGKADLVVSNHNISKVSILRNTVANTLVTPSVSITTSTTNICAGNLTTFTATTSNGGSSPAYQWKLNGLNVGVNSPIYSNSTLINNDVVSCEMTSSVTCTTTPTVTSNLLNITVNPFPIVNAGNNVSICNGNQTILNATGAMTYTWSPSIGLSSTSGSSVTANPPNTTTYTVIGTSINGCTGSDNIIVTVSTPPNPTITGSTSFCSGSSTTLNAGSGYTSYFWSTGSNSQSITVNTSGIYYVTVSNGCSGSTQISVTSKPSPNASFNVQGNCMGQTTFFYNTSSIVSLDFYLWEFGDGSASTETSPNHIYENSGNYTAYLVAFSLNGCRDTSQYNYVAINPLPIVSIMASDTIIYGNGNQVQLTVNSQGGNVQWSTGMQNPTISVNTAGHYSVTVTDQFGCSGTSSINIYQTNNNNNNTGSSIIVSSNIITPNGDGVNDYFTINNLQSYFNNGSNGNNGCRVEIYNMWNEIVYSSDYYNNDWNCQYYDGKSLPDGAYYYYIQCGRETLKGNINILTYSNYKK